VSVVRTRAAFCGSTVWLNGAPAGHVVLAHGTAAPI